MNNPTIYLTYSHLPENTKSRTFFLFRTSGSLRLIIRSFFTFLQRLHMPFHDSRRPRIP